MRPEKISSCPAETASQANQHNRADRLLAPPAQRRYRRHRVEPAECTDPGRSTWYGRLLIRSLLIRQLLIRSLLTRPDSLPGRRCPSWLPAACPDRSLPGGGAGYGPRAPGLNQLPTSFSPSGSGSGIPSRRALAV